MTDLYRYAAFVSYASKDAKFARALHRQLERYVIPSKLGTFDLTGGGKKNRVYPVFRDREELPAGDLGANLEAALRASAALIVICSPNAALSPWVEKEIQYFISLGRADRIFAIIAETAPVLIDGKDATRNSFPRPFRAEDGGSLELIAADARKGKDGFRNAWLKLIAGLIQVNAGALQDRDRKRRRSRRLAWASVGVSATAAVTAGLLAYAIPHASFAKQYVRTFGEWTPVDAVSAEDARRRTVSYRFTRRGMLGPVVRVDRVNAQGRCSNDSSFPIRSITGDDFEFSCNFARACSVTLDRSSEDAVSETTWDQYGNVLEELKYTSGAMQAIRQEAVVGCSRLDNGIKYVNITRGTTGSERGRDSKLDFFSEPGEPRANKLTAYGYLFTYDAAGRVTSETATGRDGLAKPTSDGWSLRSNTWSPAGDLVEIQLSDAAGNAVSGKGGWSKRNFGNDAVGNTLSVSNFGPDGNLTFDGNGVAIYRRVFNETGQSVSESYFDVSGAPTHSSNGYATENLTINKDGFIDSRSFFDEDGQPTPQMESKSEKGGCPILRYVRDEMGGVSEESCYDSLGKPILNRIGFHKEIRSYDSAGNITSYSYFATDGSPALGPRGAHTYTMEWGTDRLNRPKEFQKAIATRVFGTDGLPTVFSGGDWKGVHGVLNDYDNRGFVVRERYVDAGGLPARGNMGSFGYSEERDDRGFVVRSAPLGPDLMPVDIPSLSYKLIRDEYGRETERIYLDASGAPAESKGVARIKKTYDPMGRVILYETFGLDGQRAIDADGSAIARDNYDPQGKIVRREYMDENNQPTLGDVGAAVIVYDRDPRGFVTAYRYFGVDEQPIIGSGGWSVQRIARDDFGNALELRHFGINGEPVLIKSGVHGVASTFDASGNQVEFAYRGLNWEPVAPVTGEPIAIYRYGYDARNRRIFTRFFDEGSVPVADKNGSFGSETTYNDRGDVVSSVHLGADGKPGADSTGESRSETVYDNRGFIIEQRYFDLSGSFLTTNRARSEHDRDRLGNEVESRFYSADGSFRKHAISGRAIARRSFDDAGRQLTEASFGASGEPVDRLDEGWHQKTFSYSPGGAKLGEACFKVSGEELPCP